MMGKLGLGWRCAGGYGRAAVKIRLLIALAVVIAVAAGGMIGSAPAAPTAPAGPQSSPLQARAAWVPLAAVMVCSRFCPAAGVAAAKILRRTPKQIKPTRAPNPNVANAFSSAAGSSPSAVLGNALAKTAADLARLRTAGFHAHHIVAVKDHRAEFARMVLQLHGIGPNTAANGVWLHKSAHRAVHTNAYYANVNAVLVKYYWGLPRPTTELVADLGRIGKLLQKGQFPL